MRKERSRMLAGLEQDCVWLEEARQKLIEKMEWVSRASAGKIPYTTVNGRHDDRSDNSAAVSYTHLTLPTNSRV